MPMTLEKILDMNIAKEFGTICSKCGTSILQIKTKNMCKDCHDIVLGNFIEENPIGIPRFHRSMHQSDN